jgi:hypothetical protein
VAYDWRTDLLGIVARHADGCPLRVSGSCRCGPLGYRGGVWEWQLDQWTIGPLVATADEARDWQRAAHRQPEPTTTKGAGCISFGASTPTEELCSPTEKLCWWTFCSAAVGIGSILLAVAIAGCRG